MVTTATKHRVLIIDDETALRQALVAKLELDGIEVEQAVNGQEGLDRIKSFKPDLILLDQIMPIMDGQTMLTELKKDKTIDYPYVVIISNVDDNEAVNISLQKGVYDYLVKSNMSLDDISSLIKHRLERSASTPES